jgi:hypothetical protein
LNRHNILLEGPLVLDQAGAVVLGALLRIREHLVSAIEKAQCLGTPRFRVMRVKSGSHHSINTMNGLHVGLAADLQNFVITAIRFHVI